MMYEAVPEAVLTTPGNNFINACVNYNHSTSAKEEYKDKAGTLGFCTLHCSGRPNTKHFSVQVKSKIKILEVFPIRIL